MHALNKFYAMTMAFLMFGLIGEAHANIVYVDEPAFMSSQYDDTYPCKKTRNGTGMLLCAEYNAPLTTTTLVRDQATGQQWVRTDKMLVFATCQGGYCVDKNRNMIGRATNSTSAFQVGILEGYYLVMDGQQGTAHRFGTGPLAQEFPPYTVLAYNYQTVSNTTASSDPSVYDLWCDPQGDYCYYTTNDGSEYQLTRDELLDYIPIAQDTSDCMMEVCYNADMDVIGLNPDYHLFR